MIERIKLVLLYFLCILIYTNASVQYKESVSSVELLTESNWKLMLKGEWMVEFFAPWCSACKKLEPTWNAFGSRKGQLGINVGKVDVTNSPELSGRFMVTALPTIYHVKDGIFRQYKSPRDEEALVEFIKSETWKKIEPISSWKSPTSIQMSIISQFFKMSQILRSIHNKLMEDFGLPTWGSYLIFAVTTIIVGAILGLVIVCIIDFIYPPKPAKSLKKTNDSNQNKASDDEELSDNVKDDLVDEDNNDFDRKDGKSNDKVNESGASSPNARKRRARKAD